jgi:hypothetical protein
VLKDKRTAREPCIGYRLLCMPCPETKELHATAVVRDPTGGWSFLNDDYESVRKRRLSTVLNHLLLETYHPQILTYVKAVGDTTKGDPLDKEEHENVKEMAERCL